MVSVRSATWTVVLLQLVLSSAALIASLAVVSAQAQSVSRYGVPQKPSGTMVAVCALCFSLLLSTICAMFGLSNRQSCMLLPLIFTSLAICVFQAVNLVQLVGTYISPTFNNDGYDGDEVPSPAAISAVAALEVAVVATTYLEIKCFQSI